MVAETAKRPTLSPEEHAQLLAEQEAKIAKIYADLGKKDPLPLHPQREQPHASAGIRVPITETIEATLFEIEAEYGHNALPKVAGLC